MRIIDVTFPDTCRKVSKLENGIVIGAIPTINENNEIINVKLDIISSYCREAFILKMMLSAVCIGLSKKLGVPLMDLLTDLAAASENFTFENRQPAADEERS